MSERIQYIEIDVSRCSNTYGLAPCTAVLGVTGSDKCFNCWATCQDQPNYVEETETIRFNEPSDSAPVSIDSIPNIASVSLSPGKVDLGKSIGVRATLSVVFKDHRYPDTGAGGDRYLSDRDYDPYTRGTFWGKFRARYPYIEDANIRWIQGTPDLTIDQMETRHFIIDGFAGPAISGNFTIKSKDALRLADGKKALAPMLSIGELAADITDAETAITLNPVGVGATYPASGTATIGGSEMVTFTRSGDNFTIVRAQNNTEAAEHKAEDSFQIALVYAPQDAALILQDLLETYANVPSDFVPIATWQSETATYNGAAYSATIPLPTAVTTLVNELLEQLVAAMWWNDSTKLINLRILRAIESTATVYDHDSILSDSINISDQLAKRVSQVWTYYGQINPLEKINETKNYRSTLVTISADSENNFDSPAVREIFSRWIPRLGSSIAATMSNLIISRYAIPPRIIGFRLLRDSGVIKPEMAGGYKFLSSVIQDATGLDLQVDVQAVTVKSDLTFHTVTAEEVIFSETIAPIDPNIRTLTIDSDDYNLNLLDMWENTFTTPVSASSELTVVINEGVIVGSESTSLYAMRTDIWPVGATIAINNLGRIQGKGGPGGHGGNVVAIFNQVSVQNGFDGATGGDALLIEHDTDIDNIDGEIWSGGGAGAGGGAASDGILVANSVTYGGSGGGSGQGFTQTEGGTAGTKLLNKPGFDGVDGGTGTEESPGTAGVRPSGSKAGSGGVGGGAGLAGTNGQDAIGGDLQADGGTGGLPGDAIVQSGATATIINAGDIRGAIV